MIAENFEQLKENVLIEKSFVEVTEDLYYMGLESVPPIYLSNGAFQMGEPYTQSLYYTFGKKDGKYFGCLCDKNFALKNF